MMYTVLTDIDAEPQVAALPHEAVSGYLELRVVLETSPLSGRPLNPNKPTANMRTLHFGPGGRGLATYHVIDY